MKTKYKIAIILMVLALGGALVYNKVKEDQKPKIELKADHATKTVEFKMEYQDKKFASSIKLGGIRSQQLGNYQFQALSQGNSIFFYIKDAAGKVIHSKKVVFNG